MEGTPRGPDLELRQLLPEHRTVSVGDLLSALDPAEHEGRDRPHTLVNFVATVDGRDLVPRPLAGRSATRATGRCSTGCANGSTP